MRLMFVLLAAALVAPASAMAPEAATTAAKPPKDKVICKRDRDSRFGSHLSAPLTCLKRSEWKELEDNAERFLRAVHESPGGKEAQPSGPGAQ